MGAYREYTFHTLFPQAIDDFDATPLHEAAIYNQYDVAKMLIENKDQPATVFVKDREDVTPLHLAAISASPVIMWP